MYYITCRLHADVEDVARTRCCAIDGSKKGETQVASGENIFFDIQESLGCED